MNLNIRARLSKGDLLIAISTDCLHIAQGAAATLKAVKDVSQIV